MITNKSDQNSAPHVTSGIPVKRNNGLDIMKCIAMFCILTLHSSVLSYGKWDFSPLCRWAVPCFFMITGYFYSDTVSRKKEKAQILKVLKLMVIGNVIALFVNAVFILAKGDSLLHRLQSWLTADALLRFLLFNDNMIGSSEYLWYINALLYTLLIVLVFRKKKKMKVLYIATPILILTGLILSDFTSAICGVCYASQGLSVIPIYRNFLFIGIPYFCIGDLLRRKNIHISTKITFVLSVLLCAAALGEMQLIKVCGLDSNGEYFLLTPFCAISIFLFFNDFYQGRKLSAMEGKLALIGRKYVVWIYLIHCQLIYIDYQIYSILSLPGYCLLALPIIVFFTSVLLASLITAVIDKKNRGLSH